MRYTILKTEEIKERKTHIFIFLLMEIIFRGPDIGWVCEILESMFVFGEQCVSFLRGHGKQEADKSS